MNQIQTQKEAYYKKVGVAPGDPIRDTHYGTFYTTISSISRVPKRK
ncbi:hypothetical protein [Prevotella sp.]